MNADLQRRAEELFLELLDLPADEQARRLDERCAGDAELRAEVASLLGHHDVSDRFLDAREVRKLAEAAEGADLPPGTRIGEYTLGEVIGRGGMGVVYRAQQERPRRTVALKLVRRGLAGYAMLRRFEHEAELLARLQHPGIAQIYGAGVADYGLGPTPYIAMELVEGAPITTWFRQRPSTIREKLEIMVRICDAVHHAHQRGIIHRDLKPANILVGAGGEPKVLDFGVARATDADLQVTTLQTSMGQLIGTLAYMSPEQVLADPSEVDTRSDVYALGVLLFEVLAGKMPLELSGLSLAEAARRVRDDAPARLATIDSRYRGEIDTIAAKALEKDKNRRYQSAHDLAADIRAHLAGEPIAAKADSTFYVLRAQFRRHRGPALAALAVLASIIAFAIYAADQARAQRNLAMSESRAKSDALAALAEAERLRFEADAAAAEARESLRLSRIEQARLLGIAGNFRAAEDLLWPEFLRLPGDPLTHWALWELLSRQPSVRSFESGDDRLLSAAFSRDGAAVYIGDENGILRRFAAGRTEPVAEWDLGLGMVRHVRFSPTADLYALATEAGWLVIRDASDVEVGRVQSPAGRINRLDWSPDGSLLAIVGDAGAAAVYTVDGLAERAAAVAEGRPRLVTVRFHPDGTRIAAGGSDGWLHLFTLTPEGLVGRRLGHIDGDIICVNFSPDGTQVFCGGSERSLSFFNTETGEFIAKKPTENGVPNAMEYTPDGRTLLLGGWFRTDIWDVATWTRRAEGSARAEGAGDLAISRDGSLVLAVAGMGRNRLWELSEQAHRVRIDPADSWGLSASADGSLLACSDLEGRVTIWRTADWSIAQRVEAGGLAIQAALNPDGTLLATAINAGATIRIWDVATGTQTATVEGPQGRINDVRFSPDGAYLAAIGRDRTTHLWTSHDWVKTGTYTGPAEPLSFAFHPSEPLLAVGDRGRGARFLSLPTLEHQRDFDLADVTWWGLVFSPDGSRLFAGTWAQTVKAFDVASGELLATMTGHNDVVMNLSISPDGRLLSSIGTNGRLYLWDPKTFQRLAEVSPPDAEGHRQILVPNTPLLAAAKQSGLEIIDLRYYDTHIAGNIAARRKSAEELDAAGVEAFRQEVLSRLPTAMPPRIPAP